MPAFSDRIVDFDVENQNLRDNDHTIHKQRNAAQKNRFENAHRTCCLYALIELID